jgi:hypothetical protein
MSRSNFFKKIKGARYEFTQRPDVLAPTEACALLYQSHSCAPSNLTIPAASGSKSSDGKIVLSE